MSEDNRLPIQGKTTKDVVKQHLMAHLVLLVMLPVLFGAVALGLVQVGLIGSSLGRVTTVVGVAIVGLVGMLVGSGVWTALSKYSFERASDEVQSMVGVRPLYENADSDTPYGSYAAPLSVFDVYFIHPSVAMFGRRETEILRDLAKRTNAAGRKVSMLRTVVLAGGGVLYGLAAVKVVLLPVALLYTAVMPLYLLRRNAAIAVEDVHRPLYETYNERYVRFFARYLAAERVELSGVWRMLETVYISTKLLERIGLSEERYDTIVAEEQSSGE